jgi:metal-sulfur cluster biosynthetic enzyme
LEKTSPKRKRGQLIFKKYLHHKIYLRVSVVIIKGFCMPIAEESILAALRQVRDPELMVNVVDLGLIYGIEVDEADGKSNIRVSMTMTTPACPFGPMLVGEVKDVVAGLDGVGTIEVQITLSPPWTPDRMTEEARDELGIF